MRTPGPGSIQIPNRIFVGSLPLNTTDEDLHRLFAKLSGSSEYVKDVKIIRDPRGNSKG
jgi:RNA recognition motif-containing protein